MEICRKKIGIPINLFVVAITGVVVATVVAFSVVGAVIVVVLVVVVVVVVEVDEDEEEKVDIVVLPADDGEVEVSVGGSLDINLDIVLRSDDSLVEAFVGSPCLEPGRSLGLSVLSPARLVKRVIFVGV